MIRAILAALLLPAALILASADASTGGQHPSRTCFPRAKWDGEASYRPCAEVRRVYEDGSVVLAVEDADGTTRYTVGIGAKDR